MNRLPELKSFLRDGEAEWYHNVTVTYVNGKHAVLTVSDDDDEAVVREISLHEIPTKPELHALMVELGFVLQDEPGRQRATAQAMRHEEEDDYRKFVRKYYFKERDLFVQRFMKEVLRDEVIHQEHPDMCGIQKTFSETYVFLRESYDVMHADKKERETGMAVDKEQVLSKIPRR